MKPEDINYVFEENPELKKIGTEDQYENYLKTIFPESKVQDIFYHGTNSEPFENFDKSKIGSSMDSGAAGKGFYFTKSFGDYAAKNTLAVKINSKNPFFNLKYNIYDFGDRIEEGENWSDKLKLDTRAINPKDNFANEVLKKLQGKEEVSLKEMSKTFTEAYKKLGYDFSQHYSSVFNGEEIVVFEPSQIHILGSKKDLEGFKQFVKNQPSKDSLEKRVISGIFTFFIFAGLALASFNMTGNVIGNLYTKFNIYSIILCLIGIIGFYINWKYKK